jgi:hypothetical protein
VGVGKDAVVSYLEYHGNQGFRVGIRQKGRQDPQISKEK